MFRETKRIVQLVVVISAILLAPRVLQAATGCDGNGNCYIYASATGSGNGSSWTNAYTGFGTGTGKISPSGMARGVTYWIASGSYGSQTFSTGASGTSIITVEGATSANHGPASDWNNAFAGQAVWGESSITTGYWTFNGQTRGSDWQSGYTLKFWNQADAGGSSIAMSGAATNVTFQYVEFEGTGAGFPNNNSTADKCSTNNCGSWADDAIYFGAGNDVADNLYVGYSYAHHTGNTQFQMNNGTNTNLTWEYDYISYNHTGQNGQHDEAYSLYGSNVTIRYNVFQDISGSGLITTAGAGQPDLQNWDVYGNLFFWDSTYAAFAGQYGLATIDNAVLDFLGEKMSGYVHFYNNTMAGLNNSLVTANDSAFSTLAISGLSGSGGSTCGSSCPTVQIYNNIWWNSAEVTGDYSSYCSVVSGANCVQDYDTIYNGSVAAGFLNAPSETHGVVVMTTTTNPFVNFGASTIAGLELSADSAPGITIAAPYNVDMLGVVRGSDGVWDRGALQLGSGSSQAPTPPGTLGVTAVQ